MHTTSERGIALIKRSEGFAPQPVNDYGHLSWGHGHNRREGETVPVSISVAEADTLLLSDLAEIYEPAVNGMAPWANQNQFDALVDFTYNLGVGSLKQLLSHGVDAIPVEMLRWDHAGGKQLKGLTARRAQEAAMYRGL